MPAGNVIGYELLYRGGSQNTASAVDADLAGRHRPAAGQRDFDGLGPKCRQRASHPIRRRAQNLDDRGRHRARARGSQPHADAFAGNGERDGQRAVARRRATPSPSRLSDSISTSAKSATSSWARGYRTSSSSTSNRRVEFGGITPAPRPAYPSSGPISLRFPPTFIPATPSSHPLITSPPPSRN